jgi:two-component system, cell cycle response regulator CtrA
MRIALLSREKILPPEMKAGFAQRNYKLLQVEAGPDAGRLLAEADPHMVVIEALAGVKVISGLIALVRRAGLDVPILTVTPTFEADDRAGLFEAGADHLAFVPVHERELMARVAAMLRRAQGTGKGRVRNGALELDVSARTVSVAGERIALTNKEYQLLELLMLRRGKVVSRNAIMDHLYSGMDEPEMKVVDVFMSKLRSKLFEVTGRRDFIETRHGFGFVMPEHVKDGDQAAA